MLQLIKLLVLMGKKGSVGRSLIESIPLWSPFSKGDRLSVILLLYLYCKWWLGNIIYG